MAANTSVTLTGDSLGGFIPTTGGTITVTDYAGVVRVSAVPVTAGLYVPLPIQLNHTTGGTVTLAGGASGTLLT